MQLTKLNTHTHNPLDICYSHLFPGATTDEFIDHSNESVTTSITKSLAYRHIDLIDKSVSIRLYKGGDKDHSYIPLSPSLE